MSITMNDENFNNFIEKIKNKNVIKSEFTGFDNIKGKPFVAYVHKTDRIITEYVKFIESNSELSDFDLFVEAYNRGYILIYYYEYPRLEHTGNNYIEFIKNKKIRREVEKSKIKDLKDEFIQFKNELIIFEEKLNEVLRQ